MNPILVIGCLLMTSVFSAIAVMKREKIRSCSWTTVIDTVVLIPGGMFLLLIVASMFLK
jgi:hypothetical protein